MTRIKVCGNTRREDVDLALELGVELLGFIFTRSKRQIAVEAGAALTSDVPASIERVGVFIDEPTAVIERAVTTCGLTAVQLYRPITAADRALGVRLLPALRIRDGEALVENGFSPSDRPLLDTWSSETMGGGTGKAWNWKLAEGLARRYSIIVSGGLVPENVAQAVTRLRPWGVDVCSGVEAEPRRKDPAKLRAFVAAVREADES